MKWKALVVLVLVFLLGMGGGILVDRVVLSPFGPVAKARRSPERLMHRLNRALHFSEAQRTDVRRILKQTRTELKALRRTMRQDVHQVLDESEGRIAALLSPEQRDSFRDLMAKHHARRKRWRNHH